MAIVRFKRGSLEQFNNIVKDPDTIYFVDGGSSGAGHQIYLGETPYYTVANFFTNSGEESDVPIHYKRDDVWFVRDSASEVDGSVILKFCINDYIDQYNESDWQQLTIETSSGGSSGDLSDYVKKTDLADGNNAGVVKGDIHKGIGISNGVAYIYPADMNNVMYGEHLYRPITPYRQHESVFYGLAKASGVHYYDAVVPGGDVGEYTDKAKESIQEMLGIDTIYYELLSGIVGGVN